jgi:hypothetical protein
MTPPAMPATQICALAALAGDVDVEAGCVAVPCPCEVEQLSDEWMDSVERWRSRRAPGRR